MHHLVGTQHNRQLARLARIGDPLRYLVVTERHAVQEAQRTDDLVQRCPRYPFRRQMNLERADLLQSKPIG